MARPLTSHERATTDVLLAEPFPGRDELRVQLSLVNVTGLSCDCGSGSLALAVDPSAPAALVVDRVPCEGFGYDADGQLVLLFVDDGYMSELEFYGADAVPYGPARSETVELARWSDADEHGTRVALNALPLHEHADDRH